MIGGEISVKILVFILDYFQEKLVKIFFQNFQKKIEGCFGLFFSSSLTKMNFPGSKSSVSLQLSTIMLKIRKN